MCETTAFTRLIWGLSTVTERTPHKPWQTHSNGTNKHSSTGKASFWGLCFHGNGGWSSWTPINSQCRESPKTQSCDTRRNQHIGFSYQRNVFGRLIYYKSFNFSPLHPPQSRGITPTFKREQTDKTKQLVSYVMNWRLPWRARNHGVKARNLGGSGVFKLHFRICNEWKNTAWLLTQKENFCNVRS